MSEFNPELIDYLDGKISFEEFENRRAERKAKERESRKSNQQVGSDDTQRDGEEVTPSTSRGSNRTRPRPSAEEGISPSVHQAFASMMGEGGDEEEGEEDDEEEEEDGDIDEDVGDTDDDLDFDFVKGDASSEGDEDENDGNKTDKVTVGDVFALEMELTRENKKMMREKRTRSKLPRALRGLMGEANIRFARGDKEDAILMCMEIIRQVPLAYEPFSTLAMIYEDQGDMEKALQFGLIAAHLNPSDCEEWVKLADMSIEQDNVKQAIICYSKAIKGEPSNVRYIWERSSLYEQIGEHKQAMDGYRRILKLLPPSNGEDFMQLSRDMAKSYYDSNELLSAIGVMEEALKRHPELVTDECINIAAELYISNHMYTEALQALLKFCHIELRRDKTDSGEQQEREEAKDSQENTEEDQEKEKEMENEKMVEDIGPLEEVIEVIVPDKVPVDIRVKLMVCFIHQHVYKPLDPHLTSLMEQNPEDLGDLYLDVAEAFLEEGQYNSALPLLSALVCSERYNLAVVWLRHAECLKALGHLEVAMWSYTKVVDMAPLHLEARLSLSTLHQQLGHPEMALQALQSMYDAETLAQDASAVQQELKLLVHRSTLLLSQGKHDDYLDNMLTMLSMLLKTGMNRAKVYLVSENGHLRVSKMFRRKVSGAVDPESPYQDIIGKASVLSKEEWWHMLMRCVGILCDLKRYGEAELMTDATLCYDPFYDDRNKRDELNYLGLSSAYLDHNYTKAYDYIRRMLINSVERPQVWNVFNEVTRHSQEVRHHRFCLRLMLKNPENLPLCLLNGHASMVSGTFKHALGQYVQAFRMMPNHPLHSLCVGLTFFHMACQKFVIKRHSLIMQGFSFLWRYVEHRGECQESMYNLGRALHQLGLTHLAIHYYQVALGLPPPSLEGIEDEQLDLRREIAYNLSLIYQSSGNTEMARHLIYTYCTI